MANTSTDGFLQPELFPDAPRYQPIKIKPVESDVLPSELAAPDKTNSKPSAKPQKCFRSRNMCCGFGRANSNKSSR
jgi:hypothetical protein